MERELTTTAEAEGRNSELASQEQLEELLRLIKGLSVGTELTALHEDEKVYENTLELNDYTKLEAYLADVVPGDTKWVACVYYDYRVGDSEKLSKEIGLSILPSGELSADICWSGFDGKNFAELQQLPEWQDMAHFIQDRCTAEDIQLLKSWPALFYPSSSLLAQEAADEIANLQQIMGIDNV